MARNRAARPEARPLRLFVAVDVPATIRRGLDQALEPLRAELPSVRWVTPGNWHLTLKFLGSVYPRLRGWVEEQVARAASAGLPFDAHLTSLGAFPSDRRARVLWVGLDDPDGRLASLAGELDRLLQPEFDPENRPFSPHLTVARFRDQVALGEGLLSTAVGSDPFRVDEVTLYRSHLQRPAARYEPLRRFALGSAPGRRPT